jgi:hypothetical protein
VELIKRLSPDSHSVMEFKSALDVQWMRKAAQWPTLDSPKSRFNKIGFTRETDPTSKPDLFSEKAGKDLLPLIDGRNIHQFTHVFSVEHRFWARRRTTRSTWVWLPCKSSCWTTASIASGLGRSQEIPTSEP